MKNKKGFTLIEVIISIVLIVLIGGTTTFLVVNKKNDSELNKIKITKQILEAANVYVNSFKDENGKSYYEEIYKGAKGVKIPVSTLVNNGLIDKSLSNKLDNILASEENKRDENKNEQYYVAFLQASEEPNSPCDNTEIKIEASWTMEGDKPIYLCKTTENSSNQGGSSDGEEDNTPAPDELFDRIVYEYNKNGISGCIPNVDEGLCMISGNDKTEDGKPIYYYAGTNQNNHLTIKNGTKRYKFYIVRTTEDNGIKLIVDMDGIDGFQLDLFADFEKDDASPIADISTAKDCSRWYSSAPTPCRFWVKNWGPPDFFANRLGGVKGVLNYESADSGLRVSYNVSRDNTNFSVDNEINDNSDSWDDFSFVSKTLPRTQIRYYSPYYSLYRQVKNWYDRLALNNLDDYILDSIWCYEYDNLSKRMLNTAGKMSNTDIPPKLSFKCDLDKSFKSMFGILSLDEYYALIYHRENKIFKVYDDDVETNRYYELALFFNGINNIYYDGYGNYNEVNYYYFRPSIVLKNTVKITSGTGTSSNPYIIDLSKQ